MVTKPLVTVLICVGYFMILQALIPKAMAFRNPSNEDWYMGEGQRTHKRKNYMVQSTRDDMGSENGVPYDVEPFDPDRNPEELSAFIVDYANMIRNDVVLLDKSVETRTRKRGNIKVKKYSEDVIPDPPCGCISKNSSIEFGIDVFPPEVQITNCSLGNNCRHPLKCEDVKYKLLILKKKMNIVEPSPPEVANVRIHPNLGTNWWPMEITISFGCSCSPKFVTKMD